MPTTFDIVIIGAGPSGLGAALAALNTTPRPSVLLVDKLVPWEKPIACAEGVWTDQFEAAVGKRPEWIRRYISTVVLHSGDGSKIAHTAKDAGCIINRPAMQKDMAKQCELLGAEIRLNVRISEIKPEKESVRDVCFADGSIVRGRVIIDASGPVAGFGKKEKVSWKSLDLEPAYFAIVEGADIATDEIHIHLGSKIAPGGYAWAFPREAGVANVGIVLGNKYRAKADIRRLLDSFIEKNFPKARVTHRHAGAIPCEGKPQEIAAAGLIKCGDAAAMVNPFTRAGIVEALESGKLAGGAAIEMLRTLSPRQMEKICGSYRRSWRAAFGKKHEKLSLAKNALVRIPDSDYDKAFAALSKIPPEKRTITKIIGLSLGRFPRLVFAMRHLM
jgi:digeranylgeranylglycerophospholipid reductase